MFKPTPSCISQAMNEIGKNACYILRKDGNLHNSEICFANYFYTVRKSHLYDPIFRNFIMYWSYV